VIVGLCEVSDSAISWKEQFTLDEIMINAFYQTNKLTWIFIVLAHWNNSLWVDMSLHMDTLSWFQANQSLFVLLNAACLAQKQQIPILVIGFTCQGLEPTIYITPC